jgi:malonate-semialdehyde dehydrogenase (acetylating)/methylmalonate-semialdehyde dehydrogenase
MSSALPRTVPSPLPTSLVAGRARQGSGPALPLLSPIDGQDLGSLQVAEAALVDETVRAAGEAQAAWARTPIKDRIQPLLRFKSLVEAGIAELARLVTLENGKTVAESEAGIRKGLEVVEYAAALPHIATGELLEVSNGVDCTSRRYPLGVVAGITPFNFPAMVPMWMFPIAIACGNAFILKPSEAVPRTPVRFGELLAQAGLPAGVFSVLQGDRTTVEHLLDHRGIAAAAFVGSTPVAQAVYQRGTQAGKRVLALGGAKNHLVVLPDADPVTTGKNIVSSAFGCAGQRCMAASVLIAVGDCEDALAATLQSARAVRLGVDLGPVISAAAKARITRYIERAVADGGTLLIDGRVAAPAGCERGFYVGPTIIDGLTSAHPCAQEEIFGPVLTVLRVKTLDEALAIENASRFGNAASIYTGSGAAASYFEHHARAGMIGVNIGVPVPREPFAFGGWNDSRMGIGDITGKDAIAFWTKTKKVTRKWSAPSTSWMS